MASESNFVPQIEHESGETMARAVKLSRRVSIYDIRLTNLACHLGELEEESPPLQRLSRGHSASVDAEKNTIRIDLRFGYAQAYDTEESKSDPPVSVVAEFSLSYSIDSLDDISEEDAMAFARINGVYNSWPYWRELLQSIISRMGLSPVVLPLFRLIEADESDSSAE